MGGMGWFHIFFDHIFSLNLHNIKHLIWISNLVKDTNNWSVDSSHRIMTIQMKSHSAMTKAEANLPSALLRWCMSFWISLVSHIEMTWNSHDDAALTLCTINIVWYSFFFSRRQCFENFNFAVFVTTVDRWRRQTKGILKHQKQIQKCVWPVKSLK